MKQSLRFAFISMLFVSMISIAAPLVMILGPSIENRYFPVLVNEQYNEIIDDDVQTVTLEVSANKVRACKFLGISALVQHEDTWERGVMQFAASKRDPLKAESFVTRPLGQQSLGIWSVHPDGNSIKFEIQYSCHALWNTAQELPIWTRAVVATAPTK